MYKHLDPEKIVDTVDRLRCRVKERFPDASLARLVGELAQEAREAVTKSRWISRPHWIPRVIAGLGISAILLLIAGHLEDVLRTVELSGIEFITTLEAALGSAVFLGAAVVFMLTLESRGKRRRALSVIHDLRSMAHIVDLHQLTKDPERALRAVGCDTSSSPQRELSSFELGRYYDYCSETLSLISKVAAVYSVGLADPVVLSSIDEVESLCTGLSRKIWQKMIVLDQILARQRCDATVTPPDAGRATIEA